METPLSIEPTYRFCKNCANLIGRRMYYQDSSDLWKCGAKENEKGINVVSGEKTYKIIFCKDAREDKIAAVEACGREGKWYQEYVEPSREEAQRKSINRAVGITLDDI
jgi:hypothetical protein